MTTPEIDYRPFTGNGSLRINHLNFARFEIYESIPVPLTLSQCRHLVAVLLKFKRSDHSPAGNTLWAMILYCRVQGIKHKVTRHESGGQTLGYSLELL